MDSIIIIFKAYLLYIVGEMADQQQWNGYRSRAVQLRERQR